VLLWSLLALLTVGTAPVPPFLLNAITFAVGAAVGLGWTLATGRARALAGSPAGAVAFGVAGLFGFHALYFTALRLAPPAEAGLVVYLWPLLIVLMSGLLPGERLRAGHVLGAGLAFAGAAMIVAGGAGGLDRSALPGLAAAFGCAVTWALYSLGSRRFGQVPTEAVTLYCIGTALLSALAHLAVEQTVWPQDAAGWLACVALGLGPVGLAFFLWDIGVKRGDIQLLGTAAYAAPVLSTLVLILAGIAAPSPGLLAAAGLIAGGAALAAAAGRGATAAKDAGSPP
jgi:drug/metabolite transporter (DMT)-like permease